MRHNSIKCWRKSGFFNKEDQWWNIFMVPTVCKISLVLLFLVFFVTVICLLCSGLSLFLFSIFWCNVFLASTHNDNVCMTTDEWLTAFFSGLQTFTHRMWSNSQSMGLSLWNIKKNPVIIGRSRVRNILPGGLHVNTHIYCIVSKHTEKSSE